MKRNYKLECNNCGKEIQFKKNVCLLKIGGEVVSDEEGISEYVFCKKDCALRWRNKNTSFEFIDEGLIE